MRLALDVKAHLLWGSAGALCLLGLLAAARALGMPAALALAGPAVGWALERYQAVRREGTASLRDALATAAPFEALAVALWLWQNLEKAP